MVSGEEGAPKILPLTDVAVIDVNPNVAEPKSARKVFDLYMQANPKALILNTLVSGALPDAFTPLIEECRDKAVSVFIVAGNYGTDHGIQDVNYGTQEGPIKAGAIPLRDVNVKHLSDVAQAVQSAVNRGLTGQELSQAIVDKYGTPVELATK